VRGAGEGCRVVSLSAYLCVTLQPYSGLCQPLESAGPQRKSSLSGLHFLSLSEMYCAHDNTSPALQPVMVTRGDAVVRPRKEVCVDYVADPPAIRELKMNQAFVKLVLVLHRFIQT
jgi:hypothetical protein